jgi:23S rRNA (uracil1939-C5)-methyltransferase
MSRTRPPEQQRPPPARAVDSIEFLIRDLGADGDGAASGRDGQTVHVARTLPGERILATPSGTHRAILDEILAASPDRALAPCPHFSQCGGCALQHWADQPYADWKRRLVVHALERAGFADPTVAPLLRTEPGTRRRLDFAARRGPAGITLGLHAPHSQGVIDIHTCLVLHPALAALLGPLRALLSSLAGLRRQAEVTANLLDTGPDLLIRADAEANATDRTKLASFAARHGIGRIAWAIGANGDPEIVALLSPPSISFAGTLVTPPPGAFLQASREGEAAIVAAMLAGLPRLKPRARVVELFAGVGTLSFPLAAHAVVHAFEGDPAAAAALRRAAGGTRVQATHRDLTRQPLQAAEFADAAAVVLDPPFAGAKLQMPNIAAASVPAVIYVSCNPAALARDAAVLRQAGYRLAVATPVDQFVWSAQVEAVCVFNL